MAEGKRDKIILWICLFVIFVLSGTVFYFSSSAKSLDLKRIENTTQIKELQEKLEMEQQQVKDLGQAKQALEEQLTKARQAALSAAEKDPKAVQFLNDILQSEAQDAIRSAFYKSVKFNYEGSLNAFVDIDSKDLMYFLSRPKSLEGAMSEILKVALQGAVHGVLIEASKINTGKTFTKKAEDNLIALADKADSETQKEFYVSMIRQRLFQNWGKRCLISEAADDVKIEALKVYQEQLPAMSSAGMTGLYRPIVGTLHNILVSNVSGNLKEEAQKTLEIFHQTAEKSEISDFQGTMQHVKRNALLYKEKKHISAEDMKLVLTRLDDTEIERHIESIRSVFGAEVEVGQLRETLKKMRDQYKSEIDSILQGVNL